ncbi:MAG: hypothetical protein JOZ81_17990, partial [Chloroflexi bacterium]|nr:hypothetical protein [Chloroflexota bacterium]
MRWLCSESTYAAELGSSGARLLVSTAPFSLQLRLGARVLAQTAAATSYPSAPIACRRAGQWQVVSGPPSVDARGDTLRIEWPDGSSFAVHSDGNLHFAAAGAEAVALALTCRPEEHFYGLGERFDRLDQRGQVLDLWVTNQSSGTATYKPVPFFTSSGGYGLALDTTRRVYCAFGHPTVPDCTSLTVEGPELHATLIAGPHPERIVEAYTGRVGRPPVPPEWMFWPWKSRDWRVEDQASASEDIRRHQELEIPLGVKLIDAGWESDGHSFVFDSSKYPDPAALIREADQAGVRLVLWISPSMTLGGEAYREAAARGFLIRDSSGQPYVHRLGNEPGWIGTSIDFTYSPAVTWWQSQLRRLLDMGVRGFKTDFGEQIPPDAVFSDGRTGAELHNGYPVLYNRVTWEVLREYDGILLGRSGWAGSQAYPAVWAGDQTSDFSPW